VIVSLDACARLGTEAGGGMEQNVFLYRPEADPEIEVDLYQLYF